MQPAQMNTIKRLFVRPAFTTRASIATVTRLNRAFNEITANFYDGNGTNERTSFIADKYKQYSLIRNRSVQVGTIEGPLGGSRTREKSVSEY